MKDSIVIIDDEQDFLDSAKRGLRGAGFRKLFLVNDPRQVLELIKQGEHFDIALIDITMPWVTGLEVLELIKNSSPDTECIMISAVNEARIAVDCLKKGAYDYLTKPLSRDDLLSAVNRAQERKRLLELVAVGKTKKLSELSNKEAFKFIISGSDRMLRLLKEAELHAASDVPVLITGESGTGKELLARAIHKCSSRSGFPFTSINMASIVGTLFDSEFFGHTRGAFTGADKESKGFLEHTNKGTLFLDEIGDLPYDFQGKLLRVLQDGEFIKIGTNTPRRADIRFIAATNANLEQLINKQTFRKDLYYRLKGAWLHMPPLREKREDIPLLVNSFLEEFRPLPGKEQIDEEALSLLMNYSYPGNVRELRSILQSAINLAEGRMISRHFLPGHVLKQIKMDYDKKKPLTDESIKPLSDMERLHILQAYESAGKNKVRAAKILGVGLNTLRRKLMMYGVD